MYSFQGFSCRLFWFMTFFFICRSADHTLKIHRMNLTCTRFNPDAKKNRPLNFKSTPRDGFDLPHFEPSEIRSYEETELTFKKTIVFSSDGFVLLFIVSGCLCSEQLYLRPNSSHFTWLILGIYDCTNSHLLSLSKLWNLLLSLLGHFAWMPLAVNIAYSWGMITLRHLHPSSSQLFFVPLDTTWLKPCTLSIFICHCMLYCGLTPHSPKVLMFYIKHICLLSPSGRGQLPPFKGFSPPVLRFPSFRWSWIPQDVWFAVQSAPCDFCPLPIIHCMQIFFTLTTIWSQHGQTYFHSWLSESLKHMFLYGLG